MKMGKGSARGRMDWREKSMCTAAMEKMILIKTRGTYYKPGVLKINPHNNPVR